MPEHHARALFLLMEQVELLADLAMVTFFRFFQLEQIGLQVLVVEPCGAVDAGQHRVVGVAAPIGASHLHELERAQFAGVGHMRTAAEVGELALRVKRQRLIGWDAFDDFGLVFLAHTAKKRHGLVARFHFARHRQLFGNDLGHLGLDLRQIVRRERPLVGEVVEKAVVDHRADRDLRARIQPLHGLPHQMCGGMAQNL